MEGRVLASHGDGTFTIKYADGQTEEDVPDKCMRVAEARPKSQSDEARRCDLIYWYLEQSFVTRYHVCIRPSIARIWFTGYCWSTEMGS